MATKLEVAEPSESVLRCSFCGKSQKDVKSLIAGPGVYICDECVRLSSHILDLDIIAERTLEYNDGQATKPVTVRVYRPEVRGGADVRHWACRVEWNGLDVPAREAIGVDSTEALFNALDMAGSEVKRHEGLRHRGHGGESGQRRNPWPIERGPASLPMPEPLAGDVIAERMLAAPNERTVRVAVHRPQPRGVDEWICWYEIQVPGEADRRSHSVGTDSAQALFHTLARAKWDIDARELTYYSDNPWAITLESPE